MVVTPAVTGKSYHRDTLVVHAGREIDTTTGSIAPAIELSTTFARGDDGALLGGHLYGRYGNPTRDRLERCLSALEGAGACMALASGSAVAHLLVSTLETGDVLAVGADMYFGVRQLLREMCQRFGLTLLEVDTTDVEAVDAALARGPRLMMCETPTNPLMQVADIADIAERCRRAGTSLVVDNTMASPVLQRPLERGADFVMHSTTKFLSGHSDVIGGALLVREDNHPLWQRALEVRKLGGAIPSPFDCWLLLRSIGTLSLRVARQVDSAEELAQWLAAHPRIERVLYPGLPDHPGHQVAKQQMRRPGAMLSFLVGGGEAAAQRMMARLELIVRATSLGAIHTLAEHRAAVEGPDSTTPRHLIRLSVGSEAYDDLRADLSQALA